MQLLCNEISYVYYLIYECTFQSNSDFAIR